MQYIFIHGLGQDSSSWDKTISFLSKPVHAVCPDLPALVSKQNTTYANIYKAFSVFCEGVSEPFGLCGLSLGGVLALNYAIDNPSRVKSLALIGTQYKMPKTMLKLQNVIFKVMPGSAFEDTGFGKSGCMALTSSMIDLDFSAKLGSISCDTLVLLGVKDNANKKAAKGLAAGIKGAKLKLIENAAHEVNKDNPEGLAAELDAFIKKRI